MDFCFDDAELTAASEEMALLDQLINLDQDILYGVISHLHSWLFGSDPTYMQNWDNEQMITWFQQVYEYNPSSGAWNACITKH